VLILVAARQMDDHPREHVDHEDDIGSFRDEWRDRQGGIAYLDESFYCAKYASVEKLRLFVDFD
jgi:hypothetical protein